MSREDIMMDAIETIFDRLSERTATLFLGAGINAELLNAKGEAFPLAQHLSRYICRDLLGAPGLAITLDEAAEMARFRVGAGELNRYMYDLFTSFQPGTSHLCLVQLPWDIIYTTNYDLLIEAAAKTASVGAAGVIRPLFSSETELGAFSEDDILYYKLHGSIDVANTEEGRLILTKEDFRYYERFRKPLFRRLRRDLLGRTCVFIGYALTDSDFRSILEDCRQELGVVALPLSFAVRPGFADVEQAFWREKYNIQLIDASSDDFLTTLKESWISQKRSVVPFESRIRDYVQVDQSTRFQKVGESFYHIRTADCTGSSDARLFFRGAEPSWGDIRDKVAPPRDAYWNLLDGLFPELVEPNLPPSAYLVTGAAGTGKTTLLRTLSYALAGEFDLPVVSHIPGTPLDARLLTPLVDEKNPRRIIVTVRHAADYFHVLERFLEEVKQRKLPVTLLLEERKNQWIVAKNSAQSTLSPPEFELGPLSQEEIERILDALAENSALGKLTGADRDYQVQHFVALADKELLVALRELTTEGSFDDIVRDEYQQIPSEKAKQVYVYVATLGQIDLPIRYEILIRLLDLRFDQLGSEVFRPTEGVLISGEVSGDSRHNSAFVLRARHPIIASIIFAMVAPGDEAKFEILNRLLTELDPGYFEDRRVLEEIVRRRELVHVFISRDKRRAIYDRLASILPGNPYVLQHRSILERELEDPEAAIRFAREALKLSPNNPTFQNTLGLALELLARPKFTVDSLPRQALLAEASRIFEDGIHRTPADPYNYIGKANILRQKIEAETNAEVRTQLRANELSLLEEAYEVTEESTIIAGSLAIARKELGKPEDAVEVLTKALQRAPADSRIRDYLIRLQVDAGKMDVALRIAIEGEKLDPTSWRIQRHIARIGRALGHPLPAIRGHYEAAIRHHKGDISLMVELGAYLFAEGFYKDAVAIFAEARQSPVTSHDKTKIRERWKDGSGQDRIFSGRVESIKGASALALAIPENFLALFWRTRTSLRDLRKGDPIKFGVGFNAHGATARVLL